MYKTGDLKSNNFFYSKVGRAITKWGAIEKIPILRQQCTKNNSHLGTPIIFSPGVFKEVVETKDML